jgi:hypothetical protein
MSFIKKDKDNGISDYDMKHIFIEDNNEGLFKLLKKFNPVKKNDGIIILKKFKNEVKEIYNEYLSISNEDDIEQEENENEDDSESSDDELIQEVLQRRLKSESENLLIEEDNIQNSDDEDVISLSRRLRYVLKELEKLKNNLNK